MYGQMENPPKFEASRGWLDNFKSRYDVKFNQKVGEKLSADNQAAEDWMKGIWPVLRKTYLPKDIYNADVTGLYYRGFADKS